MKKIFLIITLYSVGLNVTAQNIATSDVLFSNDLKSEKIQDFFRKKTKGTQFIMLGEQHGIQEAGQTTNLLFNIAHKIGYNTLCIETSPFAAKVLDLKFAKETNPEESLRKLYKEYPYTIPFYDNNNDIGLFKNIKNNNGLIIGIDQAFMVEFRLIFNYLIQQNNNASLSKAIKPLLEQAKKGFQNAISTKNIMALFLFNYTDVLHNKLMGLTKTKEEQNILQSLKRSKEIYTYNFQKNFYLNNNERAKLMKVNFLKFYNEASKKDKIPKVLFKLGANHVAKGLNNSNVFDIANLVSEMAFINNKKSLHIYLMGVNGTKNIGNPFVPASLVPFDNSNELPKEVSKIIETSTTKYLMIDAEKMRINANSLSPKMKQLVLKYDILIYVKDCIALEKLN